MILYGIRVTKVSFAPPTPSLSVRSPLPVYPVYGRDADVLRAGQLLLRQVPPWFPAARPAGLQLQNRQLPHCFVHTPAGELQVGVLITPP